MAQSSRLSGINFVAVGEEGVVLSSKDRHTWRRRQSPISSYLRSVAYGNGTFVAVAGTAAPILAY